MEKYANISGKNEKGVFGIRESLNIYKNDLLFLVTALI